MSLIEPKPAVQSVMALPLRLLSSDSGQLMKFASDAGAAARWPASQATCDFGALLWRGSDANSTFTVQLRGVSGIEVPRNLSELAERAPTASLPGKPPTFSACSEFQGYPVLLLQNDPTDPSTSPRLLIHGVVFGQHGDAEIPLPTSKGAGKPVFAGLVLSQTCGVAQLTPVGAAQRETRTEVRSPDGKLSATITVSNGNTFGIAFRGHAELAGRTVWFAIVDSKTNQVLSEGRSDGGRAQGSVELSADPVSGQTRAMFDKTFSLPAGGKLLFILGGKE